EELLLSLGADRDEIDVESTDVFSVVGHHPLCGSDSVLEEYLICPQGSFEPGLPRRVGEVRMVGPDDLVGGERYLDVVMRTEVDDIVVTVKIDSFGGVWLDHIVGIDLRMFVSHVSEELEPVVLCLVWQLSDQPDRLAIRRLRRIPGPPVRNQSVHIVVSRGVERFQMK